MLLLTTTEYIAKLQILVEQSLVDFPHKVPTLKNNAAH